MALAPGQTGVKKQAVPKTVKAASFVVNCGSLGRLTQKKRLQVSFTTAFGSLSALRVLGNTSDLNSKCPRQSNTERNVGVMCYSDRRLEIMRGLSAMT